MKGVFLLGVRRVGLVVALLILALTVAACGGKKETGSTAAVDAVEIVVELGSAENEFVFVPDTLELKLNQPVRLVAKNVGQHIHDLHIPEFGVSTRRLNPGEEQVVELTPNKTGNFLMECREPGHAAAGMVGTVVVTN